MIRCVRKLRESLRRLFPKENYSSALKNNRYKPYKPRLFSSKMSGNIQLFYTSVLKINFVFSVNVPYESVFERHAVLKCVSLDAKRLVQQCYSSYVCNLIFDKENCDVTTTLFHQKLNVLILFRNMIENFET